MKLYTFADIGVFVSIAKLDGFMNTSGSTGRNSRAETTYFQITLNSGCCFYAQ